MNFYREYFPISITTLIATFKKNTEFTTEKIFKEKRRFDESSTINYLMRLRVSKFFLLYPLPFFPFHKRLYLNHKQLLTKLF